MRRATRLPRSCGKRRYRDRVAADLALAKIRTRGEARAKTPQRAYHCGTCRGWHLTSQQKHHVHPAGKAVARRNPPPPTSPTPATRKAVWERDKGRCAMCGDPLPTQGWHLSHRVAKGMGGTTDPVMHSPANLVASCAHCNVVVIERDPEACEWLGWKVRHGHDPRRVVFTHFLFGPVLLAEDGTWTETGQEKSA